MQAMLLTGHGGPEMLQMGEAPDPVARAGEVVVDIHAASVNGADPKVRRGNGLQARPCRTFSAAIFPASSAKSAPA